MHKYYMYVRNGSMDVRFYSCLTSTHIHVYGCFNVSSKKKLLNFYCRYKVFLPYQVE